MLFQEYAITPHVFNKEYLESDISIQIYLKLFLKKLRENGLLANMNDNQWIEEVNKYRKNLSPKLRDELSKIFEELSKHNRIVQHTTLTEATLKEEVEWLDLAIKEDKLKPYLAMIFTGKPEEVPKKSMTLEKYMENYFSCSHDLSPSEQTLENIQSHLTDFLAYAKRLIIIDPYFTYNKNDDKALLLIAELFAKRRGERMHGRKITIHIFHNQRDKFVNPDSSEYKQKWAKLFVQIYERYHHTVTLNIWSDRNMHDRYMITDQGGISNSNGFGIIDFRKPHWSLLSNGEIREQLNYFVPNANPKLKGQLKHSITKEDFGTEPIIKDGLFGKITSMEDVIRGKNGVIENAEGRYSFSISKLNKLSKAIEVGMNVEFRLKITDKGEIADIVKIIN